MALIDQHQVDVSELVRFARDAADRGVQHVMTKVIAAKASGMHAGWRLRPYAHELFEVLRAQLTAGDDHQHAGAGPLRQRLAHQGCDHHGFSAVVRYREIIKKV